MRNRLSTPQINYKINHSAYRVANSDLDLPAMAGKLGISMYAVVQFETFGKCSEAFLRRWAKLMDMTFQRAVHLNDENGGLQVGKNHSVKDILPMVTEYEEVKGHRFNGAPC